MGRLFHERGIDGADDLNFIGELDWMDGKNDFKGELSGIVEGKASGSDGDAFKPDFMEHRGRVLLGFLCVFDVEIHIVVCV